MERAIVVSGCARKRPPSGFSGDTDLSVKDHHRDEAKRLRFAGMRRFAGKDLEEGVKREYGQANTGPWWMPRSCLAKKVVVSCEKPRGGAHIPRSADYRMG